MILCGKISMLTLYLLIIYIIPRLLCSFFLWLKIILLLPFHLTLEFPHLVFNMPGGADNRQQEFEHKLVGQVTQYDDENDALHKMQK